MVKLFLIIVIRLVYYTHRAYPNTCTRSSNSAHTSELGHVQKRRGMGVAVLMCGKPALILAHATRARQTCPSLFYIILVSAANNSNSYYSYLQFFHEHG
jgi:hypothetical protein